MASVTLDKTETPVHALDDRRNAGGGDRQSVFSRFSEAVRRCLSRSVAEEREKALSPEERALVDYELRTGHFSRLPIPDLQELEIIPLNATENARPIPREERRRSANRRPSTVSALSSNQETPRMYRKIVGRTAGFAALLAAAICAYPIVKKQAEHPGGVIGGTRCAIQRMLFDTHEKTLWAYAKRDWGRVRGRVEENPSATLVNLLGKLHKERQSLNIIGATEDDVRDAAQWAVAHDLHEVQRDLAEDRFQDAVNRWTFLGTLAEELRIALPLSATEANALDEQFYACARSGAQSSLEHSNKKDGGMSHAVLAIEQYNAFARRLRTLRLSEGEGAPPTGVAHAGD